MSINARSKGQRGEREVVDILQPVIDRVYLEHGVPESEWPAMERNLMQSMKGGHDLVGIPWIAVEVKRVEAVTGTGLVRKESSGIMGWWNQAVDQASRVGDYCEPVLFYRPNNWSWSVRMFGYLAIGPNGGVRVKTPVVIELPAFLAWFEHRLKYELRNKS